MVDWVTPCFEQIFLLIAFNNGKSGEKIMTRSLPDRERHSHFANEKI